MSNEDDVASARPGLEVSSVQSLPIVLILGPPGCGKGTLCMQLAADFNLHHLSVGDWLRAQTVPPIEGVPNHINDYVFADIEIPQEVINAEYGDLEYAPAPLILYACSKSKVSTPESMKCRLMPALKAYIQSLSSETCPTVACPCRSGPNAVLLDNLLSTRAHAEAAMEVFGAAFPTVAIAVDCSDETAEKRFLARSRGGDDAARFRRRIARYRAGTGDVMSALREHGIRIIEVSTEGERDRVYQRTLSALSADHMRATVTAENKREDTAPGCDQLSAVEGSRVHIEC